MQDEEFHHSPEHPVRPPEIKPILPEQSTYSEFGTMPPEQFPTPEEENGAASNTTRQNRRRRGVGRMGFQMATMVASAAIIVTTASVASGGAFLPDLSQAALEAYDRLNVPAVSSRHGMDLQSTVLAWMGSDGGPDVTVDLQTPAPKPTLYPPEVVPAPEWPEDPVPVMPDVVPAPMDEPTPGPPPAPSQAAPPVPTQTLVVPTQQPAVPTPLTSPEVTPEASSEITPEPSPEITPEPPPETTPSPMPTPTPMPEPSPAPTPTPTTKPTHKPSYDDDDDGGYVPPPIHTHTYDSGTVTLAATCTAEGVMTYACSCGNSYTEPIPTLPHIPGDWRSGETEHWQTCSVCGTALDRFAHSLESGAPLPVESEISYHVGDCTVCGRQDVKELCTIEMETWVPTQDGSKHGHTCAKCHREPIGLEDHTWVDGVCSACGAAEPAAPADPSPVDPPTASEPSVSTVTDVDGSIYHSVAYGLTWIADPADTGTVIGKWILTCDSDPTAQPLDGEVEIRDYLLNVRLDGLTAGGAYTFTMTPVYRVEGTDYHLDDGLTRTLTFTAEVPSSP